MDFAALFEQLVKQYGPFALTLVGLIVADLAAGVGSALKAGSFDWMKVASFYRVQVIPGLLGWMSTTVVTYTVTPSLMTGATDALGSVIGYGGFGVVGAQLLASIIKSLSEIASKPAPLTVE